MKVNERKAQTACQHTEHQFTLIRDEHTLWKCVHHFLTNMQLLSQKSQLANPPHLHVTLVFMKSVYFLKSSDLLQSSGTETDVWTLLQEPFLHGHLLCCSLLLLPAGGDRADSGSGQELWAGLAWGTLGLLAASCRGRAAGRYSHPSNEVIFSKTEKSYNFIFNFFFFIYSAWSKSSSEYRK